MRTATGGQEPGATPPKRSVLPTPTLSPTDVDALLDGIVVYDLDGEAMEANESVLRMLGLSAEQLARQAPLPQGWQALATDGSPYPREDNPGKRAIRTGQAQRGLIAIKKPDGSTTWLDIRAAPVTAAHVGPGASAAGAIATVLDVTTEIEQRERLAESEDRFRLTVANAPIGMALVSLEGWFLQVNKELERILGRTADELAGLRFHDVTFPEDLAADVALVEALLADDIPIYQLDKRYLRPDGSTLWARLTVSLVRTPAGEPRYFVSQIEDISEVRAAKAQLEGRAQYDPLTGLANRSLLLERLGQALREHADRGDLVAVAFCDVDQFKRVNESLGHAGGDELLLTFAGRIGDALRPGDMVARVGGDEFVILFDPVESADRAVELLSSVRTAVERPVEIGGHELRPSFSAGITISDDERTAELLLRDADTAHFTAKQRGRSHWEVFSPALRTQRLAHLSVENELRRSLDDEAFELHYQPIVVLATRQIIAFEALVRWRHPERGLLLPAAFLDVAQDSHLMVSLGRLVIRQACAFLSRHPDAGWRVFVNASPQQIGAADLAGVIGAALHESGVPASRLGVEITENGVLDAFGVSLRDMQRVADLGVDLVMDDFGTGYSALSSLLSAPLAGIKLDRSFTARLGDGAGGDRITATVADLVRSLGAYGVVEGIETADQLRRAANHGWLNGQGYLFGRPQPERRLGPMLRRLRA